MSMPEMSETVRRIYRCEGGSALESTAICETEYPSTSAVGHYDNFLQLQEKQEKELEHQITVNMSTAICLLSEEFQCSICLDVFADPVSTPCGHNFCKNCITKHWDISVFCQCPVCKKGFYTRPELQVNIFIYKMVAHFKQSTQLKASSSSSQQQAAKPGEVPCDVCTGTKSKALKSCLVCLTSYCETHLEPHLTATSLKRHQLIEPVENLEGRMCTKHNKLLELFCKTDETCVCMFCTVLDHKAHEVVPLKEGCKGMKVELVKTEAELQQMIKERRLKIQEIKHSVEVGRANADREMAGSNQVFTKMKDVIEGNQGKVIKMLEEKHQTTVKQAESFIKELEQEISELEKRSTELERISNSEDHLHLLQNFQSLNAVPPTKDWKEVRVLPLSYGIITRTAVAQFVEMFKNEMKKLFPQLKEVQQYAVDVKLDPDTAHDKLILSDDGKQVHYSDAKRNLPNNPKRFSYWPGILGKQSFSSGRFYFEVQVKGKIDWVLGVSTESVKRKGWFTISSNNGFWTVSLKNGNIYSIRTDPPVHLPLKSKPEQVGVFVDYEEGLVSFYDVDAATVMCSFNGCSFTEKLLPFFFPGLNLGGENSAPLIICPVEDTE